jgi:hypothetical protein
MREIKRIIVDSLIAFGIIAIFATDMYESMPAPLQLVSLKALLVSAGVVHAHLVRKLIFPQVNWGSKLEGNGYASIVFYIVIPVCYAFGG